MDTLTNHKEAFQWAIELLEMTMADVTNEQAHWIPPGIANPLGAIYTHAVCAVDAIVHLIFQEEQPLYATEWAGKTGISDPQWGIEFEWARNLNVDIPAALVYGKAVFEKCNTFITGLTDADLEKELDLTQFGLGVRTVNWCINALITGHTNNMAGEISVLKGLQGTQGYPF